MSEKSKKRNPTSAKGYDTAPEHDELFRLLVENMLEGVVIVDWDTTILFANKVAATLFGFDAVEGLLGHKSLEFVHPDSRDLLLLNLETIKGGENKVNNVYRLTTKKGKDAWFETCGTKIDFKGRSADLVTFNDITERKRAEMQLKNLFEASKLINSTMDTDEIFRFISDSVQELVGFDNFIIFLVSDDRSIYPAYASEKIRDPIEGLVFNYGEGSVGHCIQTKEILLLENFKEKEVISGMKSQIVVPLIIEDECVGALHISQSAPNAYNQHHGAVLELLSEIISSAIKNSKLHHKIMEFSQELEKRIEERSKRIEILLDTKQNLQKERTWEKGLKTIVESMATLGFERCGIALVNPMKKTLEFHLGKGPELPVGTSISLRNSEYFGVKCVLEKRTIHVEDHNLPEGNKAMFESESFVWVPIIVQDEAFAALAADNIESKRIITEEDVKDLEILAGMCAAFIDRTRMFAEPIAEKTLRTEIKNWLDPSEGYIVLEKKPEKSFKIFCDLVNHGIPGFVVSRAYPGKIKKNYKLEKTAILWLSKAKAVNALNPDDLYRLMYIAEDFTRKAEESVILLDGLEYLATQVGFKAVIRFLQELRDAVVLNNSRLVIPLHRETLSVEEFSILEREFVMIESA